MARARARKGDRTECPECHRWVGYWPDKENPYVAYLMPHRTGERVGGAPYGPLCEWTVSIG